ncbi:MAG: hypothetical protein LAP87_23235 [Acidobacteriia bacterium]|nr:hypothetical protein [Terriglobia bacterium]
MDQTQFQDVLRLGLGRAILYARLHDLREFREVILDACLHCYSYDIQCEGTRGMYMYDLVGCLPDKNFYYAEVLKSLAGSGDDWDAAQRFHFAACLAFDGNEVARQAMYASYAPGPRMGELIGIDFLKMDGIKGLLFVAEKIGALLMVKPEEVDEGYLLSQSLEICGEQSTWDALRDAGATNSAIEKYRLFAADSSRHPTGAPYRPPEVPSLKYQQLLNDLPTNKPYLLWKWGERASDEELELAAKGLLAAKDSKHQLAHLRIFARRRFPLDVNALLALAEIEQDRVGFAAVKALTNVSHPAVRALAFRMNDTRARWRGSAVDLVAQNYEDGDHRIILRWFQEEEDRETLHSLGMDLIDFWERHPDEETEVPMMRSLYEKGPCSVCRKRAVTRLSERGALTDQLRAECAWDANSEIRDLVS